ncbi:DNA polymerase subunit Cdc27 [Phascolomyces articulosus]|uniref:DNA polymerase delta subunit 3 n=1 Tax=Phascolomyces articulosus TaxID=60185 RepID=A0AAD5P8N4_9FUNG|nr:DNA polymerase subunit Cdc27 [Phascolomyces articulosus]
MEQQLNITVLQEQRPVTYKSLARQQGIHVNEAKRVLNDYAQSTPNVHAIYCITGRLTADGDTTRETIRLVKNQDLEETKKQFRDVTGIHVYSVVPYDPKDLSILIDANGDIPYLTIQDRVKCGVFGCVQALTPKPLKQTQPTTTTHSQQQKPSTTSKPTIKNEPSTTTTTEKTTTKKSTIPNKRKGTLSFEKHAKKSPNPTTTTTTTSSPSTPVKATTPEKKQPVPEPKKPSLTAEDIFSEDEDMAEPSPLRNQPAVDVEDDPMEMDEPLEEEQVEEKDVMLDQEDEEPVPISSSKPNPSQKRRRKVMKKKHYTNERGFLVTEDVEEYETMDEDEEIETTSQNNNIEKQQSQNKSPSSTPKKSGTKKSQGEQRNLLSFWGKK